jgi:carbon storage regulator CsrA
MLVIGRKSGESIVLQTASGEQIVVHVQRSTRNGVIRVGIEAPQTVQIKRAEIVHSVLRDREPSIAKVANND